MLTHTTVDNVRHAYAELPNTFTSAGLEDSRNGPVLVLPGPLVTTYRRPDQRVLLDPQRDANPFFHMMEAFWMLAGRRDVESLMRYNSGMAKYSDDGKTFHGAYGYRWRCHFGFDQLETVVHLLRHNPEDRRVVLQMWDPLEDLAEVGLDFPCNNVCYFRVRDGALDMTIVCRSNDMLWGGYGANAVHFSVLQEFVASMIGARIGQMHQLSNNAHLYTATTPDLSTITPYTGYPEAVATLFGDLSGCSIDEVLCEIDDMWDQSDTTTRHLPQSTHDLLAGMRMAWLGWKARSMDQFFEGTRIIQDAGHEDWWVACVEWGRRREEKFQ